MRSPGFALSRRTASTMKNAVRARQDRFRKKYRIREKGLSRLLRIGIPRLLHRILAVMSPLTLGIYIVHPLVLKAVRTFYPAAGLKVALLTYLAVFTASALSVLVMSRIPVIRRLVTA